MNNIITKRKIISMTNYLTFIASNMDADSLWETFAQVLPR